MTAAEKRAAVLNKSRMIHITGGQGGRTKSNGGSCTVTLPPGEALLFFIMFFFVFFILLLIFHFDFNLVIKQEKLRAICCEGHGRRELQCMGGGGW
jgi:hypothetical protein